MMIAEVGDMPKVSGSSSATPETGPIPGSAPIRVPTTTPARAMNRLNGVSAMEKPSSRLSRTPIRRRSEPQDADGEGHLEPVGEHDVVQGGDADGDREGLTPRAAF